MTTRREAITRLGAFSGAVLLGGRNGMQSVLGHEYQGAQVDAPPLAPGAPNSPERMALIEAVREKTRGLETKFERHVHRSAGSMPYRLFRPASTGRLPLVMYLHGSGGLGTDNEKQLETGNIFGSRVWAVPENQERFPCYVVAPQCDQGWIRYAALPGDSIAKPAPGLGDGARLAFGVIDELRREYPIDEQRIYITGQSMGGAGVWHMISQRPNLFAAAVICCGSDSADTVSAPARMPLWNFHGVVDRTVPVEFSRERIEAIRKAGGRPISTEYAGVDHNSWLWAYSEPTLLPWLFGQTRASR